MNDMLWGVFGFLVTAVPLVWGGRWFLCRQRKMKAQHQALMLYHGWAVSHGIPSPQGVLGVDIAYDVPPSTKREDLEPWLEQ